MDLHLCLGLLCGYFKLLGTGVTKVLVVIKAQCFSKISQNKIKSSGGAYVLASQTHTKLDSDSFAFNQNHMLC